MDSKKKILIAFAGIALLVAGYLKYPVNNLLSRESAEEKTGEEAAPYQSRYEEDERREVRFVGCNGIF